MQQHDHRSDLYTQASEQKKKKRKKSKSRKTKGKTGSFQSLHTVRVCCAHAYVESEKLVASLLTSHLQFALSSRLRVSTQTTTFYSSSSPDKIHPSPTHPIPISAHVISSLLQIIITWTTAVLLRPQL